MRIGVFGGGFDPPHICHALACHYVLATADVDLVLVVPCFRHPFGKRMAPFPDRLAMCRLAFAGPGSRVEVSDIESRLGGFSYTVETLCALKAERPRDRFRLIVGSDILGETAQWKSFDQVQRLAPLLVVPRGASAQGGLAFAFPDLSSTEIRAALARGEDVSGVIPRRVLSYIRRKGLYPSPRPSRRKPA